MKEAAITKCWTFLSSKGSRHYQTLLYADGSTSCDCPGWCKRTAADGSRTCRHTRAVQLGTADAESESIHQYTHAPAPVAQSARGRDQAPAFGQLGRRRIQT